ncbi:hypothetical protein KFU94_46660 [Chloroflexi bacterium TSY]|nr:hypothetical protein [Chloroflexi bacterium TSY]
MNDRNTRDTIVDALPSDIKNGVRRHSSDRVDVVNLVNTALNYPNGLEDLIEILRWFEGDSLSMQEVDRAMEKVFKS